MVEEIAVKNIVEHRIHPSGLRNNINSNKQIYSRYI